MNKTLLLGASYEVLYFIDYKKTIKHLVKNKVEIVSFWDNTISFGNGEIQYPSIVRLLKQPNRYYFNNNFSRKALIKRDNATCQYCYVKLLNSEITMDHVLPKAQGGGTSFVNCVVACKTCNNKKDNRTPEQANMKLLKKPTLPSFTAVKKNLDNPDIWHKDWDGFLNT